ncbi:class C sortase [Weissella sp. GP1]|uniref:Class C sortase n=1 Tax=Weissella fermenti TaxID=2987699 RepID=A0ABT6D104_9LACO|nr:MULTISPECIES: class C sortase [Weissella]MBJ7687771.1 class C sortase [Weissella confusa]MCW0926682.1 class C sortase [Weissella sp. LMG 11983]MDF9299114.1 class C sortase [Weissella sp. BK2]
MAKKPRKKISPVTAILFITGLAIFSYPIVAQAYEAMHQTSIVKGYEQTAAVMPKKEKNAVQQAIEKENSEIREKSKQNGTDADVITAMTELNQKQSFEKGDDSTIKNVVGKPIGVISIPKMGGLRLPIYNSIKDKVISNGAGLIPGTSIPQAKKKGIHSVITSHSGLPNAKLFTDLKKLELKDKFYIEIAGGKTLTYQVDKIDVIEPKQLETYFKLDQTKNYVTLLTCTPTGINSHRLLVRGHQIPTESVPTNVVRAEFMWLGALIVAISSLGGYLIRRRVLIKNAMMAAVTK